MMFEDIQFRQSIVLLLLTAALSGFGIPFVLKIIDSRKHQAQAIFEARIGRQTKLLEAQASLLDELTELLWKWRYLAKQVVYYGARGDKIRFDKACQAYEETVWSLLDDFRTQISRSRRLISESAFSELNKLYDYVVHDIDQKVSSVAELDSDRINSVACEELSRRFSIEVSPMLDNALYELAKELRLTSDSVLA